MTRKSVAGLHALIRRALASRIAPLAPEPVADPSGLEGLRVMAETRAAAAEIIAQEANEIRFKALLDAAREQASDRGIRSAEARFAAAKDEWETVRWGFQPEPDPYAEPDDAAPASPAQPASGAFPALPDEMDESTWRNWLLLGGLPMLAFAMAAGIGIHLQSGDDATSIAAEQTGRPAVQALDAPLRPEPVSSMPAAGKPAAETVSTPRAKDGAKVKTATHPQRAAASRKAKHPAAARPPRIDPVPEQSAAREPTRVESIWTDSAVE
jgi:hypothetical protein